MTAVTKNHIMKITRIATAYNLIGTADKIGNTAFFNKVHNAVIVQMTVKISLSVIDKASFLPVVQSLYGGKLRTTHYRKNTLIGGLRKNQTTTEKQESK